VIYLVDEDVLQLRPYASELAFRKYEVAQIDNADDAYIQLASANDIQLVVMDIMLATRDADTSRFRRDATQDFLRTGILLIEDLIRVNPTAFPHRLAIFSMATTVSVVSQIQAMAKQKSIPYFRKRDYPSPFSFVNDLENVIRGSHQR